MIAYTNELAENVSAKVRQLDLARVSFYNSNIYISTYIILYISINLNNYLSFYININFI